MPPLMLTMAVDWSVVVPLKFTVCAIADNQRRVDRLSGVVAADRRAAGNGQSGPHAAHGGRGGAAGEFSQCERRRRDRSAGQHVERRGAAQSDEHAAGR